MATKVLKPYIDRGNELESKDPIMSYYCESNVPSLRLFVNHPPFALSVNHSLNTYRCFVGRLRGMKKAMDLKKSDPAAGAEVTPIMMDLMNKLEQVIICAAQQKTFSFQRTAESSTSHLIPFAVNQMKSLGLPSQDEAKKHCVKLTLSVFSKVDKQEKSGGATMMTVRSTPIFLSLLRFLLAAAEQHVTPCDNPNSSRIP